jgi:hypothetical protein
MELGQYQLQIFVSLVVILGAAFVALICDFLKGNNEQLRELMIELKVRREEEQRRGQRMTAHSMPASVEAASPMAAETAQPAQQPGKKAFAAARAVAAPTARKRAIAPEALAAMERGAQLAGAPRAKVPAPTIVRPAAAAVAISVETTEAPAMRPVAVASKPSIVVGKKDWSSLLARRNENATPAAAASETVLDAVPAGFHEGYVLSQLVKSKQPVSGLVVSIGVNTTHDDNGSAPNAVKELIQSLIGTGDFASQSSPEEFLLICPSERGAAAQRRLSEIAEQLWNFQLRSMGNFSILFSWGGVEVRSESIDEAIASANERMMETRRGRKLLMMEPRNSQTPLRQAV